ncbi:hypothetical protein AB9K41_05240, partial [Cribrihabitans sp. XS_ASV171]
MTTLSVGDIAIIGVHAEASDAGGSNAAIDGVSFVLLRDIDSGTVIKFTDSEWTGSDFDPGEGAIQWTATGNMTAGTVIRIEFNTTLNTQSATSGTVSQFADSSHFTSLGTPGQMAISTAGDQVFAYQGTAGSSPTPITAFTNRPDGFVTTTSGSDSQLPATLTEGVNATSFQDVSGAAPDEYDNSYYDGPTSGTLSFLQSAIHNAANWRGSNDPIAFD